MKSFTREIKKVPGVFWYMLILGAGGALTANLAKFFPENTYWWSALIISLVGGVLLPAITYVWGHQYGNPPQPSATSDLSSQPDAGKPAGLVQTIFWGNR